MNSSTILPRRMTIDEFEPLVGQWMTADCNPEPVKIKLIEASPLRHNEALDRPPFMLIFHSAPEVQLLDGGYVLRCGQFGPDIVHISSMIAPFKAEPGFYYQAIFN